jgi:hypothetical protein
MDLHRPIPVAKNRARVRQNDDRASFFRLPSETFNHLTGNVIRYISPFWQFIRLHFFMEEKEK